MYRLVFRSRSPITRRLHVEYGPWQPDRHLVDKWIAIFEELGRGDSLSVEEQRGEAPTLKSRFVQT
ncbi:hypothetical protein E4K72_09785 [Oxalobacteraceae bacterium OM1]|nr:hypothetical protein E4K72_09785 [Oxalobacteraceae bacterium OM1]